MANNFGKREGDTCFRDGCAGVISEHPSEGCCSCHINPPCGHCTTDWAHCDVCGWRVQDDKDFFPVMVAPGLIQMERTKPRPLDPRKVDYRVHGHTHFTQRVVGVYPLGTKQSDVEALVKGTFGGRWESFGKGKFGYIAYTD